MNSSKKYSVVGVMSGTSLDGIDFCYARFQKQETWTFQIIKTATLVYPASWKEELRTAHLLSMEKLEVLNQRYTLYLSQEIANFIHQQGITNLDMVASHGHTVLHQPQRGITLQIGNLPSITTFLPCPVIGDFRIQDVKLGGQGAPLVPMGDQLLFSAYDYCLNLGGFANVSFQQGLHRVAYDICPANIVLNYFAEQLGMEMDMFGNIAKSATPHQALLQKLNKLEFYQLTPPKSLGKEWVEQSFLPVVHSFSNSIPVILATLTHHIAFQIAQSLQSNKSVLVTGGGAFNSYLISLLQKNTTAKLFIPEKQLINYKEALIFAFLGILKVRGEINVLASVTGARKNHSTGVVFSKE